MGRSVRHSFNKQIVKDSKWERGLGLDMDEGLDEDEEIKVQWENWRTRNMSTRRTRGMGRTRKRCSWRIRGQGGRRGEGVY